MKKIFEKILNCPTAPYREGWVLMAIKEELKRLKVPYFQDSWGNIISGVKNKKQLQSAKKTALIAHTDHPGFHIVKKLKNPGLWQAQWHGGHPPKLKKSEVHIYNPKKPGFRALGIIQSDLNKKNFFNIKIKYSPFEVNDTCFGSFNFPGYKIKNKRVHTRAADDLAGVVIILGTYALLNERERGEILGLFTVAEETGFKGTIGILNGRLLGKKISAISLEASRQMSGARIGKGPVLRQGDKKTIFNNNIMAHLEFAADFLQKTKKLKFQKRIMNGGTCEATAFNLFGIPCGGIAIPLGNYHNQRSNGKPGAEFVDFQDVKSAIELCRQYYKNLSKNRDPQNIFKQSLVKEFKASHKLMRRKISYEKF